MNTVLRNSVKVGRPVKTWRRSVEEELKAANITRKTAKTQLQIAQYPLFHSETNQFTPEARVSRPQALLPSQA